MAGFTVRCLDEVTWPDFAQLVERHNGVWGGCWCMAFHAEGGERGKTFAQKRSEKEYRVREGRAHAALVYEGTACVGWCQFGPTEELPRIKAQRAYREGLKALPRMWRTGRSRRPSCTMEQCQCLSKRVSSATVASGRIAGLSPKS